MGAVDISTIGMLLGFALVLIPIAISYWFDLRMIKDTIWSILRMTIQLALVGIFLEYIFKLNNAWLNLAWLGVMILAAIFSAIKKSKIKTSAIIWPILIAFSIPTVLTLLYFNAFIIQLDYLFDARYLIALGGMILGNVLSSNIVAINSFFQEIKSQYKYYLFRLSMGASNKETLLPFFRKSFQLSLLPALAKTATIGLVSLPGMMTGQILGGSSPTTAIKYQIMIMIAIYVAGSISVLLSLLLSTKRCFDEFGIPKASIYKKQ